MNDSTDTKQSWWQRLSGGLKRTSASISGAIADLVVKRRLDQAMLDEIEEVLIRADLGVDVAAKIAAAVGEGRYDKEIAPDEVKAVVAAEVEKVLAAVAKPLAIGPGKPFVVSIDADKRRIALGVAPADEETGGSAATTAPSSLGTFGDLLKKRK